MCFDYKGFEDESGTGIQSLRLCCPASPRVETCSSVVLHRETRRLPVGPCSIPVNKLRQTQRGQLDSVQKRVRYVRLASGRYRTLADSNIGLVLYSMRSSKAATCNHGPKRHKDVCASVGHVSRQGTRLCITRKPSNVWHRNNVARQPRL